MFLISYWHKLRRSSGQPVLKIAILVITGFLSFLTLAIPIIINPSSSQLMIGDVAPQDIQSSRTLTFESAILTEKARQEAERAVPPVYTANDQSITRKQIEKLRIALAYITTVRADTYASEQQKIDDIAHLSDIRLSQATIEQILELNENRWTELQAEAIKVLEQIMRNTIRDTNIEEARRDITTLISLSWTPEQTAVIAELVSAFVTPNSLYDEKATEANRKKAVEAVQPVTRSFITGEMVVQLGQVISDLDVEALQELGLFQPKDYRQDLIGAACLVALLSIFTGLYFTRNSPQALNNLRSTMFIALMFIVFLLGARIIIPNRTILPYLFPIPAFGLILTTLFSTEIGLILSMILSILSAYGLTNTLDLTFYYILGSFFGILTLGKAQRVASFIWASIAIAGAGIAIVLSYRIPNVITDWIGIATLISAAFFNGLASGSLTILLQFIPAQFLGLTTALQLLEISRPDHPLLQQLLRSAPGSYQHSLMVANLAEQAAERIGADTLLTRVGALYHDIGKIKNPLFYIENQIPGKLNPHDDLDPVVSAATIIQHVTEGLVLARKYRIPPRVQDFIPEHHGTLLTRYQYSTALELADNNPETVNPKLFQYPGPKPRSRETALVMLADGVEARARAEIPKTEKELKDLIKDLIDLRVKEGQLDLTAMTLKDLNEIVNAFTTTLRGVYHPRIVYPDVKTRPLFLKTPWQETENTSTVLSGNENPSESESPLSDFKK